MKNRYGDEYEFVGVVFLTNTDKRTIKKIWANEGGVFLEVEK